MIVELLRGPRYWATDAGVPFFQARASFEFMFPGIASRRRVSFGWSTGQNEIPVSAESYELRVIRLSDAPSGERIYLLSKVPELLVSGADWFRRGDCWFEDERISLPGFCKVLATAVGRHHEGRVHIWVNERRER